VVFVEDVRSVPIGKVLKVDGAYAAVRFPTTNTGTSNSAVAAAVAAKDKDDSLDAWQDCRLMRKDELQVSEGGSFTIKNVHFDFLKSKNQLLG
jgi:E3 ubiquitin-protein ligase EDD1